MKLKDNSVRPVSLHPRLIEALFALDEMWREELNYELILTSLNDGRHRHGSLHYAGCGADIRTWTAEKSGKQLASGRRDWVADRARKLLGADFDVVDEGDHLHIEYQPKKPT